MDTANSIDVSKKVNNFQYHKIVAPMINQSDPPFRTLCLKYGATMVYTEMLYSDKISFKRIDSHQLDYLKCRLQSVDHTYFLNLKFDDSPKSSDRNPTSSSIGKRLSNGVHKKLSVDGYYRSRPLVAQICGNIPENLAKSVQLIAVSQLADAIDFNLGCPQVTMSILN